MRKLHKVHVVSTLLVAMFFGALGTAAGVWSQLDKTATVVSASGTPYYYQVDEASGNKVRVFVREGENATTAEYRSANQQRIDAWRLSPPAVPPIYVGNGSGVNAGLPIAVTFKTPLTVNEVMAKETQYDFQSDQWMAVGSYTGGEDAAEVGIAWSGIPAIGVQITDPITGLSYTLDGILFIQGELHGDFTDMHALSQDADVHVADSTGIQSVLDVGGDPQWLRYLIQEVNIAHQLFDLTW